MSNSSASHQRTSPPAFLYQEFLSHTDQVSCLNIAPSADFFATGANDNSIHLYKLGNCEPIHIWSSLNSAPKTLVFSDDQSLLAAGFESGAVRIFSCTSGDVIWSFTAHKTVVSSLAFTDNASFIASGSIDSSVRIWNMKEKNQLQRIPSRPGAITCLLFAPSGSWLLVGDDSGRLLIWSPGREGPVKELVHLGHAVRSVSLHPVERLIAVATDDRTVRFWDLDRFESLGRTAPRPGGFIHCLLPPPAGRPCICLRKAGIECWGYEPSKLLSSLKVGWGSDTPAACALRLAGRAPQLVVGVLGAVGQVGIWVVSLKAMEPYSTALGIEPAPETVPGYREEMQREREAERVRRVVDKPRPSFDSAPNVIQPAVPPAVSKHHDVSKRHTPNRVSAPRSRSHSRPLSPSTRCLDDGGLRAALTRRLSAIRASRELWGRADFRGVCGLLSGSDPQVIIDVLGAVDFQGSGISISDASKLYAPLTAALQEDGTGKSVTIGLELAKVFGPFVLETLKSRATDPAGQERRERCAHFRRAVIQFRAELGRVSRRAVGPMRQSARRVFRELGELGYGER